MFIVLSILNIRVVSNALFIIVSSLVLLHSLHAKLRSSMYHKYREERNYKKRVYVYL